MNGRSRRRAARAEIGAALVVLASMPFLAAGQVAHATGAVASLTFSPSPIAAPAKLAANATVTVTVTAKDATGAAISGATVYLSFMPATGGGAGVVASTPLTGTPQPFTANNSGQVAITYRTPSALPTGGEDTITAQNAASSPAVTKSDLYKFSKVAKYVLAPDPIATTGSLAASTAVPVSLTAETAKGAAAGGATVYLALTPAAGGGSAMVGGTPLTPTPHPFVANSGGQVAIAYSTPATLPPSGTDTISAEDATTGASVTATDTYAYQTASTPPAFATGELQWTTAGQAGCGVNGDGEPQVHVSQANNLALASEEGLGFGSDAWNQAPAQAGSSATSCALTYRGQPNAVTTGVGASGGDVDVAWGSATGSNGTYPLYVSSSNAGSIAVATSTDNGATYSNVPVQGGLPVDDREWIAAYGATSSLLSFHDGAGNIDVLRSDATGAGYVEISQAIPASDHRATANEIGNLVIDHDNTTGVVSGPAGKTGFLAYQAFVAPSSSAGGILNEAFVAVSHDGGFTWSDQAVGCSTSIDPHGGSAGLDHQFPDISVDPSGVLWYAWSDNTNIYVARSPDQGSTWSCAGPVSTNTTAAVMPWLVGTSAGVDLVYYGTPTPSNQTPTWAVYFAQDAGSTVGGFGTPQSLTVVHYGAVCEAGINCNGHRQLYDDFGIDTDQQGYAHIAYSSDASSSSRLFQLGGTATATGYAVQTAGTVVGRPN